MKRIVILIAGTWNKEGVNGNTNVAQLDSTHKIVAQPLITQVSSSGIAQHVHYHDGVGSEGDWVVHLLGGFIGLGLKKIIHEVYEFLVTDYNAGDEIYLFGFSRGAYAARALAGLIGASGIQRHKNTNVFEIAWRRYRVKPAARRPPQAASSAKQEATEYRAPEQKGTFHDNRSITCVGVWDTVGSYGIPAGFGRTPLGRIYALVMPGFHDTNFGDHVKIGLHAIALDEHRRPFVPTFPTIPKGQQPKSHVEQTWFAGAHANVGGGYADGGLSDQALVWMIARMQAMTKLEFNAEAVKANTKSDVSGTVVDSTSGWPLDHAFPHYRTVLSPVAIHHGYLFNSKSRDEEHINERVHWSVMAKRGRCEAAYGPCNLPRQIPWEKIAPITAEERTPPGGGT